MARSAVALNPASTPFFPGGIRASEDDLGLGFGRRTFHETDRSSMSSVSISPSDYRSVRCSPSPPQQDGDPDPTPARQQASGEGQRRSPPSRLGDVAKPEARRTREGSMLGGLDPLAEREDSQETPGPSDGAVHHPTSSFFPPYERTAPVAVNNGTSYNAPGGLTSSSPVSSLDSGSHFATNTDQAARSFEAQLKASPMIHDILDRLLRCEYSTREMQRDVGDMQRKVNLLVERSLGIGTQPEFKDPFAVNGNGQSFSSPPLNGPRPSIGNIAPNQSNPSDDLVSVSQRLDMLTASVGQLTAASHQIHASISPLTNMGSGTPQIDLAPNQMMSPPGVSNSSMLGHGLPNRPDLRPSPRAPNSPMRTWSAGTLDLPMRPSDPSRQDALLRDKRRSVSGLVRRDSAGILDMQNENWMAGSPRDSGPMISKWEQLSLAPDLLRSLSKFGVGPPNKIQQRALPFLLRGADIIAQAPPTQERIAAYVIPAIQIAVTNISVRPPNRGPIVIMVSTTVDQATQAQRMIRDLGGPIGVRSALGVGATTNDLSQELRLLQQNMPHIICGTPQKLHALFTSSGGLVGSEVRFLVLDEVDQLIARNLHEFVFNIVKLLPPPRSRPLGPGTPTPNSTPGTISQSSFTSPFDSPNPGRRFSGLGPSPPTETNSTPQPIERQTALFSNTVPQDVLNLASAIQLREPVRVLVRRDGNVTHADTAQSSRGLRQFYLYLAFTAGGRSDPMAAAPGGGLGIIGSGRGASSAESAQAREWKLDALADLFDDVDVAQAVVHVGGMTALDSVVYKLASRGLEAVPLHGDMNAGTKLAALNKFRGASSVIMRQPATKVLVVYDVQVKTPEVAHVPLIINYDLPKAVEEYAHRVAPAIASNYSRAGVIVNFVTATGGDVEMLRSIEIKCPEVPMSLRDIV
ncbi:hypothetical protein FB451DRAFT_1427699 [Mycena latifolia]|nr:hypothetical protein FB451DRAFT_1427699 [Mycena latifolia]